MCRDWRLSVTPEAAGSSPVDPANYPSVNKGVPVDGGSLLANRPETAEGFVCKRFASGAGLIEIPHRFVETSQRRVEVRAGLLQRRMAEHVLHVMHWPTGLEQARAAFVPEVVEASTDSMS